MKSLLAWTLRASLNKAISCIQGKNQFTGNHVGHVEQILEDAGGGFFSRLSTLCFSYSTNLFDKTKFLKKVRPSINKVIISEIVPDVAVLKDVLTRELPTGCKIKMAPFTVKA